MLQVEHVAKKFGDRQVLEDVNLKVNQGGCGCNIGGHLDQVKRLFSDVSIIRKSR